jgi:uncharacterized protein YcbK (DUF882 family)
MTHHTKGRFEVYATSVRCALATTAAITLVFTAFTAKADITHVVQRGHTVEAIAHRYHVTVKSILEANHLSDPRSLKPGQSLVIPGVDPPSKSKKDARHEGADRSTERATTGALERIPEPRGHTDDDVVHAVRLGEEFRIRVKDSRGHIPSSALGAFERMLRQGNAMHSIDPRLVALVGIVSNHFGGRTFEVVSGYRAYSPTQYTPHSNHNYGKAVDFRIRGVPNEALRDFCRTLRSAGCGYYPNSTFVHLDVRDTKAYWVDWSHPGEAPQYEKPGSGADEGTSDVPSEATQAVDDSAEAPAANPAPPSESTETHGPVPVEAPPK